MKELWTAELQNSSHGSPVVWLGLFFYAGKSAEYSALDASTGATVLERQLLLSAPGAEGAESANLYPSLTMAVGSLYIGDDHGNSLVLEATRNSQEIARNRLPKGSGSTPAVSGASMVLRAGEDL